MKPQSYRCDTADPTRKPLEWLPTGLYFATEQEALACGKATTYGPVNRRRWSAIASAEPVTHRWTVDGPVRIAKVA